MAIGGGEPGRSALPSLSWDLMGLTAPKRWTGRAYRNNGDAYTVCWCWRYPAPRGLERSSDGPPGLGRLSAWPAGRNIMRVALVEIGESGDVPVSVALDEAVGLAKRYCSDEAAALVNGVLAGALSEIEAA